VQVHLCFSLKTLSTGQLNSCVVIWLVTIPTKF
jgi:hypothetical protein